MKLYYSSGACAISPNIALHEAGIDFDAIAVDLKEKKTEDGRDFYQINKKGSIPVLEIEDGVILTEGPALLQYIADQVPEKNLAPANGTMERYRLQERLNFITSELHKGFPMFFEAYGYNDDARVVAKGHLEKKYAYLEDILSKQEFLMESGFSVADCYLYNVTRWTPAAGIDIQANYPNVYSFMERMEARSSVQSTLRIEDIPAFTQAAAKAA